MNADNNEKLGYLLVNSYCLPARVAAAAARRAAAAARRTAGLAVLARVLVLARVEERTDGAVNARNRRRANVTGTLNEAARRVAYRVLGTNNELDRDIDRSVESSAEDGVARAEQAVNGRVDIAQNARAALTRIVAATSTTTASVARVVVVAACHFLFMFLIFISNHDWQNLPDPSEQTAPCWSNRAHLNAGSWSTSGADP